MKVNYESHISSLQSQLAHTQHNYELLKSQAQVLQEVPTNMISSLEQNLTTLFESQYTKFLSEMNPAPQQTPPTDFVQLENGFKSRETGFLTRIAELENLNLTQVKNN
jgi:hypothetical protein